MSPAKPPAVGSGYSVIVAVERDAADRVAAALGEPERAVGAGGDRDRERPVLERVALRGAVGLDAVDGVAAGVGHPHRPVGDGDGARLLAELVRADPAVGGDAVDLAVAGDPGGPVGTDHHVARRRGIGELVRREPLRGVRGGRGQARDHHHREYRGSPGEEGEVAHARSLRLATRGPHQGFSWSVWRRSSSAAFRAAARPRSTATASPPPTSTSASTCWAAARARRR